MKITVLNNIHFFFLNRNKFNDSNKIYLIFHMKILKNKYY